MREFLTPVTAVHPEPADQTTERYVRSYLIMRTLIGALGIALPFALVLVDGLWFDGSSWARPSLSDYYYSGVRELFVGSLCAIGVFLITYKVAEVNLDNALSLLAGVAVLVVALFPTERSDDSVALTPLQRHLGETVVGTVHFSAATVFISSLGAISYFFGRREGTRPPGAGRRSPGFWKTFHWICAGVILAALVWSGVTALWNVGPSRSLLYGEAAAVWAFGLSWLWKGLELDQLLHGRRGEPSRPAPGGRL
jgi:hypothetical protein